MKAPAVSGILIALAISFVSAPRVYGAHETPLYRATLEYREAVLDFEREVFRSNHFDRFAERLADDLEDASGRLKSAGRRCDQFDRLTHAWQEVRCLEPRVAEAIFAGPACHVHEVLSVLWHRVMCASREVEMQIALLQSPLLRPVIVPQPIVVYPSRHDHLDQHFDGRFHDTDHLDPYPTQRVPVNRSVEIRPWPAPPKIPRADVRNDTQAHRTIERASDSDPRLQRRQFGEVQVGARLSRRLD